MPAENGTWNQEEADEHHIFDYRLAQFIGQYLPKTETVVDLGCGKATYLRYLHDIGFESLKGIEGFPLRNFEISNIEIFDLTENLTPVGKGNVISFEVAEHLKEEKLETFYNNIINHCGESSKIILSHAIPNQDGIGHISCRHNVWVINEMEKRGFKLLCEDSLKARSVIEESTAWFRNTLLIFKRQ